MDRIAGPYLHTLTGILGDKRSTMLESEVQYRVGITGDCGTLGIVLFKLEWDGRYRTVLAVKCNRQNRIP